MRLSRRDYEALLKCIGELTEATLQEDFPLKALAAILRIISCDSISYNEFTLKRFIKVHRLPVSVPEENLPVLVKHGHEHPLVIHKEKNCAIKISDFLSDRQYRRTGLYNEYYKNLDVNYQLSVKLPSYEDVLIAFSHNRGLKDFSERDRLLLDLLKPVLVNCLRNAQLLSGMKKKLETSGHEAKGFRSLTDCGLTGRETEILRWLAWGKTNKDIATILQISPRTVHKHLENIYLKLGVDNRTAAAALAIAEAGGSFGRSECGEK